MNVNFFEALSFVESFICVALCDRCACSIKIEKSVTYGDPSGVNAELDGNKRVGHARPTHSASGRARASLAVANWLQHKNGPARPVRYYTFTEYRYEVTAFAVTFHPLSESPGSPFAAPSIFPH
ncbi:hypothetical protein EVAR_45054_1 [Eumeta japonica]|uniref:Secreted protein n=1 Tax=Eumeta variegata TaxID=151549 RepID=A0A4C1ZDQ0_EUMVA|nr:hypothetical protein EVAR_45054_1 [Eumeta japonica]